MSKEMLSNAQAINLLRMARTTLEEALRDPVEHAIGFNESGLPSEMVNVTLYYCGQLQASMGGRGPTLVDAVVEATQRAVVDDRFRPRLTLIDLANVRIELWIYLDSELLSNPYNDLTTIDLGIEGIELQQGTHYAYYKPSVAITSAVTSQEQLLRKLAKKADLSPDAWCEEGTIIRRTQWIHLVEDSQRALGFLQLRRLRPIEQPDVTRESVEHAAKIALARLLTVQDPQGFYLYKYHPFKEWSSSGPTNLVRQAGCAYAVAWGAECEHEETQAQALTLSAIRAITYLLSFAAPAPGGGICLVEPDQGLTPRGKLGTIALTLLALQRSMLMQRYEKQRQELVTAILGMQEANGAFHCYTDSNTIDQDDTKQDFFPGEALLALCHEARFGSVACLGAVERAFPWYREHFKQRPTTAFVLWHTDTWRLLFEWCDHLSRRSSRDPEVYARFVFEMIDWLLQFQLDSTTSHSDFIGGFAHPGEKPTFSSAAYTEAVIRTYGLATRLLKTDRMQRYQRAALAGLQFLFRLQITPEMAILFRNPAYVIGGTTRDLVDFTLRCDYNQHAITAFLAALETPGLLDGC